MPFTATLIILYLLFRGYLIYRNESRKEIALYYIVSLGIAAVSMLLYGFTPFLKSEQELLAEITLGGSLVLMPIAVLVFVQYWHTLYREIPIISKSFYLASGASLIAMMSNPWEIRESNPQSYSLYQNGVVIGSGALTESYYTHSLAGLVIGAYTYTLVVYDTSGQSHTSTCYITVANMSPPTLSRISDCRFLKSDPNAILVWQAYDLHPSSYTITTNGAVGPTLSWDGSEITLHCEVWLEGNYTILIQVSDTSGNLVSDEVKVEIFLIEASVTEAEISPGYTFVFVFLAMFITIWVSRRRKRLRA